MGCAASSDEEHATTAATPTTAIAAATLKKRMRTAYVHARSVDEDTAKKEEALAFVLRELERTVAEMGSKLLVVYIPTNYYGPPEALPRVIGNIRFLDLTERFKRNKEEGGSNPYIAGDGHPSAAGHALIADEIAKYIRREGLL